MSRPFGLGIGLARRRAPSRRRPPPPLNALLSAAAFSLRLLRTAHAGAALRVRRSFDNAEADIGFDAAGGVSLAALTSFVGGENLILESETYASATWAKTNATVSGTTLTSTAGGASATGISQVVSLPIGVLSFSVDVLTAGTTSPWIRLAWTDVSTWQAWGNLSTGAAGSVTAGATITSAPISGGFRFTLSRTQAGTSATFFVRLADADNSTNAPASGSTVVVANTRINTGSAARPYFVTTTTANAGNGFVATWYDQSGNAQNATQTTAAQQPRIVNAGVVETLGGRPTVRFLNASGTFLVAAGPASVNGLTVNHVHAWDAAEVSFSTIVSRNAPSQAGTWHVLRTTANRIQAAQNGFAGVTSGVDYTPGSTTIATTQFQTAGETFNNGASLATGALGATQSTEGIILGAWESTRHFNGRMSEVVLRTPVLSASDRQSLERNQGAYYGIAVA